MKGLRISIGLAMICSLAACQTPKPSEKMPPMPPDVPPPPAVKAVAIDPDLQAAARKELLAECGADDPFLRSNAIEAMSEVDAAEASAPVLRGLDDPEPTVRFAAALAAGKMGLTAAYHPLLARVESEKDGRVRAAVLFGLHKLGDTRFSHELEQLAVDPDSHVRAATAQVLGLLGEPSAAPILARMLSDVPVVRIQAAEALWRLGDERGLTMLVAYSVSMYPDDQIIALQALAETGDQRVLGHICGDLTGSCTEVSLAAARGAGELGSDEGWSVAVPAAGSKDPRQRSLAALAMGAIGRSDLQRYLEDLLKDPEPAVRISAATAILQLRAAGQ